MPDALTRNVQKIGSFVGLYSLICKVDNVNNGGVIAINGSWAGFPDEQDFTYKRVLTITDIVNKTGGISTQSVTLTGYELKGKFNQRDADAYEFDMTYAGYECALLVQMHKFSVLSTPKTQWLAVFGTMVPHTEDVSSKDGFIPWLFKGTPNAQAVVLGTGGVAYPTITGFTAPGSAITIPAYTGRLGIYKISDL